MVLLAALLPLPLRAASTGTTNLFTISPTDTLAFGDFVSAPGGLNTFHAFFVEVPPGLARLDVDLFDADFGAGGAAEAAANRDRDRDDGFTSDVAYTLRAPNGGLVATRYALGTPTLPAGSDNAWTTFFSSNGSFADDFTTVAYSNNTGSDPWTGDWTEVGDNGTPTGEIRIAADMGSNRLLLENTNRSIFREANLNGRTGATLGLDFRRNALDDANDFVVVEVSANGGGSYTVLETFAGPATDAGYTTRSYNISAFIAANTRVRFRTSASLGGSDTVFFDNVSITSSGTVAGHWELRADVSAAINTDPADNDVNAFGLRAHDGTPGAGGTEINVYSASFLPVGTNHEGGGTLSRTYQEYPWITSGCSFDANNFDWDTDQGAPGAASFTSRTGAFAQVVNPLSNNNVWQPAAAVTIGSPTSWATADLSVDYGVWSATWSISEYPGPNGNYAVVYVGSETAANPPPASQPAAGALRIYLPTDAAAAPLKPYLEQLLTHSDGSGGPAGPNPPVVGQTSQFTVTVRLVNPTPLPITFSTPSNIVTANVPGGGVTYNGGAQLSQGAVVSQPAIGGIGNVTWNPGTLAAGATALLSYRIQITPPAAGTINATGTPASNGTRAQYLDETGNATQARATYLFGGLCQLSASTALATPALVSAPRLSRSGELEWDTHSEADLAGFELFRWDAGRESWTQVGGAIPALLDAPQGGRYRVRDPQAPSGPTIYALRELGPNGAGRVHGPFQLEPSSAPASERKPGVERRGTQTGYERRARRLHPRAPSAPWFRDEVKPPGRIPPLRDAALKIGVGDSGLYLVDGAQIAAGLGIAPAVVDRLLRSGGLSLSGRDGTPVAWTPGPGGLLFYGEAVDSLFSRDNVYWLRVGNGERMRVRPPRRRGADPAGTSFLDTRRIEQDLFPGTLVARDPNADYWFWEYLSAGDPALGRRSFPAGLPGLVAEGDASLRVDLHGATASGLENEHHARVSVNGLAVGEMVFDGAVPASASFTFPARLLREADTVIEVEGVLGAGVPWSIFYVDGFEVSYPRRFRALSDALTFRGDGAGRVSVTGFTSPELLLLEIGDPRRPVLQRPQVVDDGTGGYGVDVIPSDATPYLAAARPGWMPPRFVERAGGANLRERRRGADYVIVTRGDLVQAASGLANLRSADGLRVAVEAVEDVLDAFGGGFNDPAALRGFLEHARRRWNPAPRYVVLLGPGSYDYRDLLGLGGSPVPPLMVPTAQGLFASDAALGDLEGEDGVPEVAVGRVAVRSAEELAAYVRKLAAYEGAGAEDWSRRALLLADDPEPAGEFHADSERLSPGLEGFDLERLYFGGGSADALRQDLIARLSEGVAVVGYTGHGGLDRLATEGLLTSADVPGLASGDRTPFLAALTCVINRFEVPGLAPLGDQLVRHAGGGAAAVWAPTGLSDHNQARELGQAFFRERGEARLGDRIARALSEFAARGGARDVASVYTLLGDPALRLRWPEPEPPPAPTPLPTGE